MAELDEYGVAVRVASVLEELAIEYSLGGSLASSIHGEPRSTNDIDFAVALQEHQVSRFVDRLGPDFVADEHGLRAAVRAGRSYQIFFLPLVLKIDLFIRGAAPFDRSEFARRIRVQVGNQGALYAASREDSLLRKLVWFRDGGEVSDRQWRDVLGLLRTSVGTLDRSYVEHWATALGVHHLLTRALDQA